jgi:endo-1,4-beta-xylanase
MTSTSLTRRQLCGGIGAVAVPSFAPSLAQALEPTNALAALAATKGITFGCQISSSFFSPNYLGLYRGAVRVVTPENDLKAWRVHPSADRYDYSGADRVVDFASSSKIAVHGHTLIWGNGKYNPPWIRDLPNEKVAGFIDQFIKTVVGRYRGRILSWDVVNEPTSLGQGNVSAYQEGPFFNALGPGYVGRCFQAARAADPNAILVLNEAQTERDDKMGLAWRKNLLTCLDGLVESGAPIQAVGLQAHLRPSIPFDPAAFDKFLTEIERRNLDIYISELDVDDASFPDDVAERDKRVAETYHQFLSAVLPHRRVKRVVTWGMADPYSFYVALARQKDPGAMRLPRPLLLDEKFARKPAWFAVERALREAPARG